MIIMVIQRYLSKIKIYLPPPSLSLSLPLSFPLSLSHEHLSFFSICMVSCVTKVGIKELQEQIHSAALNAKDPDTHEHVIGMQVYK